jgi:hypothetical protein
MRREKSSISASENADPSTSATNTPAPGRVTSSPALAQVGNRVAQRLGRETPSLSDMIAFRGQPLARSQDAAQDELSSI